ncbi:aminoglycoside phosphotransferase family protein [Streptomyces sp. NPDC093085]|uniref:aminoglycoside phosphotransferase family protein n=1 Tax=Streptomyces sp. NPDC093085 TaxID=3155068 RepID=UPI0034248515
MIDIPREFARTRSNENDPGGRAFLAALPARAADLLDRWELRVDGPSLSGRCALVLPVEDATGTPAMLKLQEVDEETTGEPLALRAWAGQGAVRLLRYETEAPPETDTPPAQKTSPTQNRNPAPTAALTSAAAPAPAIAALLLERLRPRDLNALEPRAALPVLAGLLARLGAVPAPAGLRGLGDIARRLLAETPARAAAVPPGPERRLLLTCAAALREVADDPGERLLHWDLHFENVLAADRAPWLAIDPKPLAGHPGFELLPALRNRFDPDDTLWRFDLMTETLALDREAARAWTLGRVLQNLLWRLRDKNAGAVQLPVETSIAQALLAR